MDAYLLMFVVAIGRMLFNFIEHCIDIPYINQ